MSLAAKPVADAVCFRQNGFVRDVPGVAGSVLGVMKRGEVLPRASQPSRDGWLAVVYRGDRAWVAERFVGYCSACGFAVTVEGGQVPLRDNPLTDFA